MSDCDHKGLIRESYRIEGIDDSQCRSIFLDWALSLKDGMNTKDCMKALYDQYGVAEPDHPMSKVLTEGLSREAARKGRRRR